VQWLPACSSRKHWDTSDDVGFSANEQDTELRSKAVHEAATCVGIPGSHSTACEHSIASRKVTLIKLLSLLYLLMLPTA
jgi:hypothetical protein